MGEKGIPSWVIMKLCSLYWPLPSLKAWKKKNENGGETTCPFMNIGAVNARRILNVSF
jgi:hypothetical protein